MALQVLIQASKPVWSHSVSTSLQSTMCTNLDKQFDKNPKEQTVQMECLFLLCNIKYDEEKKFIYQGQYLLSLAPNGGIYLLEQTKIIHRFT